MDNSQMSWAKTLAKKRHQTIRNKSSNSMTTGKVAIQKEIDLFKKKLFDSLENKNVTLIKNYTKELIRLRARLLNASILEAKKNPNINSDNFIETEAKSYYTECRNLSQSISNFLAQNHG